MSQRIKEAMRLKTGDYVSRIGPDYKSVIPGIIIAEDGADAEVNWRFSEDSYFADKWGKKYLKAGWLEPTKENLEVLESLLHERTKSRMRCAVCGVTGLLPFVKKAGKRGVYFCWEHLPPDR